MDGTTRSDTMATTPPDPQCCLCNELGICDNLGYKTCPHCCQSICCIPCNYAVLRERANGNPATNDLACGCMPVPQTGGGILCTVLLTLCPDFTSLVGIFSIRLNTENPEYGKAILAECCYPCMCYGNPCHMNQYRIDTSPAAADGIKM